MGRKNRNRNRRKRKHSKSECQELKNVKQSIVLARRSKRFNQDKWTKVKSFFSKFRMINQKNEDHQSPKRKDDQSPETSSDSDQEELWSYLEQPSLHQHGTEISEIKKTDENKDIPVVDLTQNDADEIPEPSSTPVPSYTSLGDLPPVPEGTSARKWSETGLGKELSSGVRQFRQNEFGITVLSYNVLSDQLMKDNKFLYRGKTNEEVDWESRWPRLLSEVLHLDADILCLQEVDATHFGSHYVPTLDNFGYTGIFKKRTHDKSDGCAIFYKREKLNLLNWTSVEYFQPNTDSLDRDNIGLIAKFVPAQTTGRPDQLTFCVATTHLLFNPGRHDVKLAQLALLLAELDRLSFYGIRREVGLPPQTSYFPCILTGDLNLKPDTPVYNFLVNGTCNYSGKSKLIQDFGPGRKLDNFLFPPELGVTDYCQHIDVISNREASNQNQFPTRLFHSQNPNGVQNKGFLPPNTQHLFGNGGLVQGFRFRSVYTHLGGEQAVTAHQDRYTTVDYLLYSTVLSGRYGRSVEGNLKLVSRLRLLSGQQVQDLGGLPSLAFPSDHLCLVAKFILSKKK